MRRGGGGLKFARGRVSVERERERIAADAGTRQSSSSAVPAEARWAWNAVFTVHPGLLKPSCGAAFACNGTKQILSDATISYYIPE